MEDYKKKYENALNAARKFKKDCPSLWDTESNPFRCVFEELKESEDERIIKAIIEFIKQNKSFTHCKGVSKDDCLTWLEKQGEQKSNFCHHEVDLSDCSEEYRKAYYDGWNNCNQQHSQLKAEQKPAWSEDDERYYNSALWHIKNYCGVESNVYNWLKSLKERMKGE